MQASPVPGLPPPDETSARHSARCAEHIRERIRAAGGSLSFREFMHEALYAPGLGYYAAGTAKFGRAGDFVTAPEVSPLFGRVLASVVADVLATLGGGDILEFGAGSGRLAVDVLRRLEETGRLPDRYAILEVSAELRDRQARLFEQELPGLRGRIRWLERLPESHRGVVIANEVLDALPVERFTVDGGVRQLRVAAAGEGFAWTDVPAPRSLGNAVRTIEAALGRELENGYTSEVSPLLGPWIGAVADCLDTGAVLLFDYGASRREYYAPDRSGGWLRCHFRHHAHSDPLVLPGIQDLSAWVEFTAVAEAARGAGLDIGGYVTQAQFLLSGGIVDELTSALAAMPPSSRTAVELASQVKMLTLPGQMGERFKCLGLVRDLQSLPPALTTQDRTHTL
ncbi:MAG TPA: SAM-dependent methyltransferase [Woeseiaceae bacterium]|nr:SAM-dependent methyltransferase [Woeseiaceae bacterium]